MTETPLRSQDFTWAKAHLSDLMTGAVVRHQPQEVVRHGRESMVLLGREDLMAALEHFRFTASAVWDAGEATVEIREVGVLGFGASLDEAIDDAVVELRLYAERFFENATLYMASDRRSHAPWLLRVAMTDADHHRALLEHASSPDGRPIPM